MTSAYRVTAKNLRIRQLYNIWATRGWFAGPHDAVFRSKLEKSIPEPRLSGFSGPVAGVLNGSDCPMTQNDAVDSTLAGRLIIIQKLNIPTPPPSVML